MSETPSFRQFLGPSLFLIIAGWGGITALLIFTEPVVWMRWALFALLFMGLTGTFLPIIYFFHLRFPSVPPAEARVLVRQAQWIGTYGIILLWLRSGDLLTLWLMLGLGGGLIAIEWLIRMRENARWNPPTSNSHDEPA